MTKRSIKRKGITIMTATPEEDKMECSMNQTQGTDITRENSRNSIRNESKNSTEGGGGSKSITVQYDPAIIEMVRQLGKEDDIDKDDREEGFICRNYHIFCFCCCDIRRACIILNAVHIGILIFLVIFVNIKDQIGVPIYEDDLFQEEVEGIYEYTVLRSCIGIPISIVGIVGAFRFQSWPVFVMSVWLVAYVAWQMIGKRYFSAAFAAFLVVPELCLFFALKDGKITREHYEKQKQCCWTDGKK